MLNDQTPPNSGRNGNLEIESLVSVATGKAIADSHTVAEVFGKRHDHVLRDIDNLLSKQKLGDVQQQWFTEISAAHPTVPSRTIRSFEMTRDGFTLLAMGFTGDEALEWKIKYLEAFNAMETQIRTLRSETPLEDKSEAPTPEFNRYARERLHKIYSTGLFDPEDLLLILFRGNIPYTGNSKYPLYLPESCEAIDISQSDPAFERIPSSEIATIFVDTAQGPQERRAITETALYYLVFTPRVPILTALAHAISSGAALWQTLRKGHLYLNNDPIVIGLDGAMRTAADLAAMHLRR